MDQQQTLLVQAILMSEIYSDETFNCRGRIAPVDVQGLADDIDKNGLDQPITVQRWDGLPGKRYMILAGHRRFMACRILKKETINCFIKVGLDEATARGINIRENVSRKDLNIKQEARGIAWYKLQGWTEDKTAQYLSQSRGWIQIRYMLLDLPMDVQDAAAAGLLNQQQLRKLHSLRKRPNEMYALVRKIKDAKAKGESVDLQPSKSVNPLLKKRRERPEVFNMIDVLYQSVGMGLHTRVLAWCAGEINTYDLYKDIKTYADSQGIEFEIPQEILTSTGQQYQDTFL